jgi:hypothetical protein
MARMGHSSPRAALIYQHATEDRDVVIAEALSAMVFEQRKTNPQTPGPKARTNDSDAGHEG